jgi:hypothetical protein
VAGDGKVLWRAYTGTKPETADTAKVIPNVTRHSLTLQYNTLTFADGSTIVSRRAGTLGGTAGVSTTSVAEGEIIKGTGRFEGIKGTLTTKGKFLPIEKDEAGPKLVGEGTITYTLPSK